MARFYCPLPLVDGQVVDLPPTAARHVQVLRMQPGHTLTLFNGEGGEFSAEVQHMGPVSYTHLTLPTICSV